MSASEIKIHDLKRELREKESMATSLREKLSRQAEELQLAQSSRGTGEALSVDVQQHLESYKAQTIASTQARAAMSGPLCP